MLSLLKHFSKAPQFVFATVKIIANNCLTDYIAHAHLPLDGVWPVERCLRQWAYWQSAYWQKTYCLSSVIGIALVTAEDTRPPGNKLGEMQEHPQGQCGHRSTYPTE